MLLAVRTSLRTHFQLASLLRFGSAKDFESGVPRDSRTEDRTMSKTTRRKMGVSAFVALAVLGTGWVVERASSNAHVQGATAINESVSASEAAIVPVFPPRVTNSTEPYDRSDPPLSQG